jgi:signal transduction histidine kinase
MVYIGILYSALLAASLFNTILLLWLGLTIVLNTERRNWGVWLTGGGLAAAGLLFLSHSAVLIEGATYLSEEINAWWPLGWAALIFTPFTWYVAMLWYDGYWDDPRSGLRRRHRPLLWSSAVFAAVLAVLYLLARPLPFTVEFGGLAFDLSATPAILGVPLLVLLYPFFILSCTLFSTDALLRPGPTARAMGDLARLRARPWLLAASSTLLAVSLLVVGSIIWLLMGARYELKIVVDPLAIALLWIDLAVSVLVALATLFLGQAIVSYEIFTGRTLPRRGLRRHWRRAIALAAASGLVLSFSFLLDLPHEYVFLFAALLIVVAYAVSNWRAYAEREEYMTHLREFAASDHVYDSLLTSEGPSGSAAAVAEPFTALARDVLGAQLALLAPMSTVAPLVQSPLAYPQAQVPPLPLDEIARRAAPNTLILSVDPAHYAGASWAVPLWGARGLTGLLLLGPKADGRLYSQEEIEIAQATGERLLDSLAAASLAQRLMALQRQRFTQDQVVDQHARRAIHDDVLPALHALIVRLGEQQADRDAVRQLAELHRRISGLLREMPTGSRSRVGELGLTEAFRQMVEREYGNDFDAVNWEVEPGVESQAASIPPLTADVIFYAAREIVRNAARHGRGGDPRRALNLRLAVAWRGGLAIEIEDDGVGASPADGQDEGGQGLALHTTMLEIIGGSLAVERRLGAGTRAAIFLPEDRCGE